MGRKREAFGSMACGGSEIPQDNMVLRGSSDKTVLFSHHGIPKRNSVGLNLLGVGLKPERWGLLQCHDKSLIGWL